jgi:hypothetical protein
LLASHVQFWVSLEARLRHCLEQNRCFNVTVGVNVESHWGHTLSVVDLSSAESIRACAFNVSRRRS